MARTNNLTNFLTDVASAIKTKKGSETSIPAANFDTEILALPSQGNYQIKTVNITNNGETIINPDVEYDAMNSVVINTQVPMPSLQNKSYEFTSNQNITLLPDAGYAGFTDVSVSINVPTGIDTSDANAVADDILEGKTAYVNGVKLTGTYNGGSGEDLNAVISEQENLIANLYNLVNTKANGTGGGPFVVPDGMRFVSSKLTTFPNDMDMSTVTDMGEMFAECMNLVNIPEFNTINAINMSAMFWNCTNLVEMADIDTSNVVNARNMFCNCTNLTNLPNIIALKMLDASALFYNCTNLVDIPKINIITATNISHICQDCINLVNITDFTTGQAVDMSYAFCNCVNLANISSFSAYNTANMQDIFTNCNNLSADSYANIANSLPLAANLTNQYVVNLGLNIINFTDEQVIILNNKGYIDAIPKANTKGTTYNITYTI
jgi:ribosomal protein S8